VQLVAQLRRYVAGCWRHRWRALGLAWLICLPGWTAVYLMPNQYQSTARIYADADVILGQLLRGIAVDGTSSSQVDMLQRTLLSRPNLERVVARTDLDLRITSAESREALLVGLAKDIKITAQTRNLFTIAYTDRDPQLAQSVVQTVLALFVEATTSTDRQQMESARTFVAQQLAAYETQLREAEQRRAEFRTRYLDLLPNDAAGGATRLEQSRVQLTQLRGELQDAQRRGELTRQQLEATPPAFSAAELAGAAGGETRLAEAERGLRELRLRYTDQHPEVIAARSAIADLRANPPAAIAPSRPAGAARGGGGRIANPQYEQLKLRMVDVDAQVASLERRVNDEQLELERLETLARNAPQVQAQFLNLDRDYNVLRKSYEEFLTRRESVQIAGAARNSTDRVRLDVVDPPTLPTSPSGPKRLLFATGVLLAGLGAGGAMALLLVQLDTAFYTLNDLRRLGLPVLGGVSAAQPPRPNRLGAAAFAGSVALLLLAFGAVLTGGSALVERVPALLARMMA